MKTTKSRLLARSIIPIAMIVIVSACGSQAQSGDSSSATTTAPVVVNVSTSTALGVDTSTTAAASVVRANANSSSLEEVAAALSAAGVANADRWARGVLEYRPYDTSDVDLTHLREELAKYNPGDGVVDAIVSALEL